MNKNNSYREGHAATVILGASYTWYFGGAKCVAYLANNVMEVVLSLFLTFQIYFNWQ